MSSKKPLKTQETKRGSTERPWLRTSLALFGVVAGLFAGSFFVIGYLLPEKISHSLIERGKTPEPVLGTPMDHGMKYSDVTFKSSDGLNLSGWWIDAPKGKPQGTAVLVHGVFHNRTQMLSRAVFLHKAGYQVLMFDLRGHGQSDHAPLTGGLEETRDLLGAVDYLKSGNKLKEPLVLFGLSLGGMAAMRAGVTVPEAVLIVDSPLADARAYVSRRTLGKWFIHLPGFFDRCMAAYNHDTGLHLTTEDLDLIPTAQLLKDRWVLFFVGERDELARVNEVDRLFKYTATRTKHIFIAPSAGHEGTLQSAPALYERTVLEFMDAYKKKMADLDKGRLKATR